MMKDFLYQNGDKVLGSDNNNTTTATSLGRAIRATMAYYGFWPAGRGLEFGNKFWQKLPLKHTTETEQQVLNDFQESLQELVNDEKIIIEDLSFYNEKSGQIILVITILDSQVRSRLSFPVELPWEK